MSDDWKQKRKIVTLPTEESHTPQNVLARTLEKATRIKSVVIFIEWDDGSMDVDYSAMKLSEMFLAAAIMKQEALSRIEGRGE